MAAKVRLSKAVRIAPMSQVKAFVVSNAAGLIVIEPRAYIVPKYHVRGANGVAEVLPERPISILLSNFGSEERRLPKGMVLGYASKHPLALVPIVGEAVREFACCLHLSTQDPTTEISNDPQSEEKISARSRDYSTAKDWMSSVDLSHIGEEKLRDRILTILGKYSEMWSGHLGEVAAEKHRIELKGGAKPAHQMPYRQVLPMRENTATAVKEQLEQGVIEPAASDGPVRSSSCPSRMELSGFVSITDP